MNPIKKYAFTLPFFLIGIAIASLQLGGIFYYIGPILVFGIIPLLDLVFGYDHSNPPEELVPELEKQKFFRWITYLYVPGQYALIGWGAWLLVNRDLQLWEMAGLITTIGIITGGLGITVGHELGHKTNALEKRLSQILLASVSYAHFFIEHNQGHHVNVSTPKDSATSRLNENFYRFYPRTVIGGFRSAWELESRRLSRKNRPTLSLRNRMLWYIAAPIAIASALGLLGFAAGVGYAWQTIPFFFAQSVIAFSLLEVVNYIEHYGLSRAEIAPGKYEKVNELHSWNSNATLTNLFLFHLQRHSDHHANELRRYQSLRHFEQSPQLPTGYAGMIWLAIVPPLWYKVMNPRVKQFYRKDQAAKAA